jgi:hypothetical protein
MPGARHRMLAVGVAALHALLFGCAPPAVPDPRVAASAYAAAAARGDSDAIYSMMTSRAQKALSRSDVKKLVEAERAELAEEARALLSKDAHVTARARLRFADGEEVALDFSGGRFRIASAGTLPGGAATPEEALDELRRVIARRSYAGLVRLLSPATRAALEQDLRGLVTGLEHPDTLRVDLHGEDATVDVPGGHKVRMKREGGVWRVEDFD